MTIAGGGGPLNTRTWDLDREEGAGVQTLRDASAEPLSEPLLEVPDDIKGNLVVTSVDALVNWKCSGLLLARLT